MSSFRSWRQIPSNELQAIVNRDGMLEAQIAQLEAEIEWLTKLLTEAREIIYDEVEENYPWRHKYPRDQLRYEIDMGIVHRIDAALNTEEHTMELNK